MHLDFCSSLPLGEAEEYNGSEHGHWVREIGLAPQLCHVLSVLLNLSEPQFLRLLNGDNSRTCVRRALVNG